MTEEAINAEIVRVLDGGVNSIDIYKHIHKEDRKNSCLRRLRKDNHAICEKCIQPIILDIRDNIRNDWINCDSCGKAMCEHFTYFWCGKGEQTDVSCLECTIDEHHTYDINLSAIYDVTHKFARETLALKDKIKDLEAQIRYQPGGEGAMEAQLHFESLLENNT